jgi:DNA polymerase III delta subunit
MITVIHGDDLANSRKYFTDIKGKVKNPVELRGDKVSLSDLVQALEGSSFFSEEKNILIENFLSQKKTNKQFKEIIEYLFKNSDTSKIYFWEDKEVGKVILNSLKNAESKLFKLPQSLFLFLDSLKPNSAENVLYFHKVISRTAPELVYFMIVRQFRILFALTQNEHLIDELKRIASWQRGKLEKQARLFGEDKLIEILNKLYNLDYKQKYGLTSMPFVQNIDFFLMEI